MINRTSSISFKSKFNFMVSIGLCFFISLSIINCSAENKQTSANTKGISLKKDFKIKKEYNDTALFLAGKEIPESSKLFTQSRKDYYIRHRKSVNSGWNNLQSSNNDAIKKWKAKHIPKNYTDTIFYPFSGPDIMNALLFFPDGTEYIMFGLESPGKVPSPQNYSVKKNSAGLSTIRNAIAVLLRLNFFKTKRMATEVSTSEFNSITSVIMFFLARFDYEVVDIKYIWIDNNSKLTTLKPKKRHTIYIPGVEILFRKNKNAPVKRLRYFKLNVIDRSLKRYTNFIPYLETYGRYTTIIKSASYLMHNVKKFTKIRALTLSHSDIILQDDSGIAMRYFDTNKWKITYHGTYDRPIPLFAHRYQAEFDKNMKKLSTGPLPFSYGYDYGKGRSNLTLAVRVKK